MMGTTAAIPPITIAQYLGFKSPPGFRDELINGKIVVSPNAKPLHHDVVLQIYNILHKQVGEQFKVAMQINVKLDHDHSMPAPDVSVFETEVWRHARETDSYPAGAPILAVEVLSRSNNKPRVREKTALYLMNGSQMVLIVYPKKKAFEIRTRDGSKECGAGDLVPLPSPLPAMDLDSTAFFLI